MIIAGVIVSAITYGIIIPLLQSNRVEDSVIMEAYLPPFASIAPAPTPPSSHVSQQPISTIERQMSNSFIIIDSHLRYITYVELESLSLWQLTVARNEIFARHGRIFVREDLRIHFESTSWYNGHVLPDDFSFDILNNFERANIDLIQEWERKRQ